MDYKYITLWMLFSKGLYSYKRAYTLSTGRPNWNKTLAVVMSLSVGLHITQALLHSIHPFFHTSSVSPGVPGCCPGLEPGTAGISDTPPPCCTPPGPCGPGPGCSRPWPGPVYPGGPLPSPGPAHNTWDMDRQSLFCILNSIFYILHLIL